MGSISQEDILLDEEGTEKVAKAMRKFYKRAAKANMSVDEVGVTIALLQRVYFDEVGGIPLNAVVKEVLEATSEAPNDVTGLAGTIAGMCSDDYRKRFVAEYRQLKIRHDKLVNMTAKYAAGALDFDPACPLALLREQQAFMAGYLKCLEVRAEIESIDLKGEE